MWCNWKGEPSNWAGPLPSLEMVASGKVHASPSLLRFRNPSFFISGFIHHNRSMWSRILHDSPVRSTFLRFLEFGVDATEFFVKFEGSFQGQVYSGSSPPRAFFPNSKSCRAFSEFISKTILERVANGSLSVWGKVGEVSPPHLVIASPLNLQNPACAMMKDFSTCGSKIFRSPWILLLTSPVTSITIVSKPRAMTKVGMTMSVFRQTVGHTSVFSGMDGTLFLILSPLDGRLARTFIILSVWSPLATFVLMASHVLNI